MCPGRMKASHIQYYPAFSARSTTVLLSRSAWERGTWKGRHDGGQGGSRAFCRRSNTVLQRSRAPDERIGSPIESGSVHCSDGCSGVVIQLPRYIGTAGACSKRRIDGDGRVWNEGYYPRSMSAAQLTERMNCDSRCLVVSWLCIFWSVPERLRQRPGRFPQLCRRFHHTST